MYTVGQGRKNVSKREIYENAERNLQINML